MFKVFVTHSLPGNAVDELKGKCEVLVNQKEKLSKKELKQAIADVDGFICLLTDKVDAGVIKAGKKLKVISNYAVGVDNIDVKSATKRKIAVTNTPGVLTQAVAEHTFALLMAIARRIPESDWFTRKGKYKGWKPNLLLGVELKGKTLGVIGMGRIGSVVAKIARQGYEMKVVYYTEHRDEQTENEIGAKYSTFEEVLTNSDFVSIHVPLTEKTRHLIGEPQFAMMKKTAYLINTSRGPVVDENALVKALQNKTIAGAALDVFEFEPKLAPGLNKLDNVVLTPHIASATMEARSAMAEMAVENLLAVLEGRKPLSIVNPEVLQ